VITILVDSYPAMVRTCDVPRLVLVHNVNGNRMEKFYLIGVTLLSFALNVPTFGLHHFGYEKSISVLTALLIGAQMG
jgi:hypothetical protein